MRRRLGRCGMRSAFAVWCVGSLLRAEEGMLTARVVGRIVGSRWMGRTLCETMVMGTRLSVARATT